MTTIRRLLLGLPLRWRLTTAMMLVLLAVILVGLGASIVVWRQWPELHMTAFWPAVVISIPVVLVIIGVAVFAVTRFSLAPIVQLTADANEINHLRLSERVTRPPGGDEVAALADTLNDMLDNIDRGVTLQKQFISDASHELKSPVTAILSNADLALSPGSTEDELREALMVAQRNASRLAELIDHLVALAVIDEAEGQPHHGPVNLNQIVASEVQTRQSTLTIELVLPESANVIGKSQLMRWAIGTVLDNAIRHASGKIVVAVNRDERGFIVSVDDDGEGVPPDQRERVFERFARVEQARGRNSGGAGLGLAIAKAVTEAHGGWVWVTDSPLGGARFELGFAFDGELMD